ncbi:Homeobox protein Hox-A3a [Thelohanellus kitauei]|uniref:Homeobox protein Hox-A3a n=1 Tax=Thelohanellus kitauei TaxID=669202 RepID=A0A0C2N4D3_THEKT|nr:Homeobox protein Hox-A3a [Thelohanellus kitauei]
MEVHPLQDFSNGYNWYSTYSNLNRNNIGNHVPAAHEGINMLTRTCNCTSVGHSTQSHFIPRFQSPPSNYTILEHMYQRIDDPYMSRYEQLTKYSASLAKTVIKTCAPKRKPIIYTAAQLKILEREFAINNFAKKDKRMQLANDLNVDQEKIRNWFQNRRKKQTQEKYKCVHESLPI